MTANLPATALQRGATLLELLISLAIVGVVFASMSDSLFFKADTLSDQALIGKAESTAQQLRDMLSFDLRMLGAAMPLSQSAFMTNGGLGDAHLPVLLSADNDLIEFRLNENGKGSVLSTTFTPTLISQDIDLLSSADLKVGDMVYVSNLLNGGNTALQGFVASISTNRIRLAPGFKTTPGASFAPGSRLDRIAQYSYASHADWSGITRDSGSGAVLLAPSTTFTVEYLDANRDIIPLPLSQTEILTQLSFLKLTVYSRSSRTLRSGRVHQAESGQLVALRNLRFNR